MAAYPAHPVLSISPLHGRCIPHAPARPAVMIYPRHEDPWISLWKGDGGIWRVYVPFAKGRGRGGCSLSEICVYSILTPGNMLMFPARLIAPEHICMDRQFQRIPPSRAPSPPLLLYPHPLFDFLPSPPPPPTLQRRQARRSTRDIRVTTYDCVAQIRVTICECAFFPAFPPAGYQTDHAPESLRSPNTFSPGRYRFATQPTSQPGGRSRKPPRAGAA